jgi:uncharacterized protein YerC
MQLSKKKVSRKLIGQFCRSLAQIITDIRKTSEAEQFLKDFLTDSELELLTRRLGVAYFLDQNQRYQHIKNNLGVSSATIANIAEQIKKPGLQIALTKVKAEEWATRWAKKISQTLGKR